MTADFVTVKTRREWRTWLTRNHATSPGIWLVRYKAHTGVPTIAYEDAVREALCFGWIDSLTRRLDDERYALKMTPRKPTSKWSDSNRARWKELKEQAKAWIFFRQLSPAQRRLFVTWIHTAKRPETRERRIRESISLLAAGKKLGIK